MTGLRTSKLPSPLNALLYLFAAIAAILWLLPLVSSHSVLFPAGPNYEDIIVYKGRFTVYHSAKFFTSKTFSGFAYPPGAAPIYEAFYRTSDALLTYLIVAYTTAVIALIAAYRYLHRNRIGNLFPLFLLFSFPLIFLIQRANIELILWIIVALGILAYRRGLGLIAAVLFGLAAAVKLYPIFLLGLFLKRRQDLPAFAVGCLTAVVALIAATAYAGPTFVFAAHGFINGVGNFQGHYVDTVSRVEVAFDHSLFSPIKYWAYSHHTTPAPWTQLYYLTAGTFALLLFLRVRTMPTLNNIVFLTTAMVSLPPVSFNYTLVHLYLPMLLLLAALTAARTNPTAALTLALILSLMLPLIALSIIHPIPAGPIQSFTLLAILILCAITPWPEPAAHERSSYSTLRPPSTIRFCPVI
jgi:hypothetical protein